MSAPVCPKCGKRPRCEYVSDAQDRGRYAPYCRECLRSRKKERPQGSYGQGQGVTLHRMADQYRPQQQDETMTKGKQRP